MVEVYVRSERIGLAHELTEQQIKHFVQRKDWLEFRYQGKSYWYAPLSEQEQESRFNSKHPVG